MKKKHVVIGSLVAFAVGRTTHPKKPKPYTVRSLNARGLVTLQDEAGRSLRRHPGSKIRADFSQPDYDRLPLLEVEPRDLQPLDEAITAWAAWHRDAAGNVAARAAGLAYEASVEAALRELFAQLQKDGTAIAGEWEIRGAVSVLATGTTAVKLCSIVHDEAGWFPGQIIEGELRHGALQYTVNADDLVQPFALSVPRRPAYTVLMEEARAAWTPEAQEALERQAEMALRGVS